MASAAAHGTPEEWCWPPFAPWEPDDGRYRVDEWAPASTVRRPWLRVGRWTLLYRRVTTDPRPGGPAPEAPVE
jgi:hypothetical protein